MSISKIALAFLVMSGCSHESNSCHDFTCGGIYLSEANSVYWDYPRLNDAIKITLQVFRNRVFGDARFKKPDVSGYTLQIIPGEYFISPDGRKVVGLTYCDLKTMLVSDGPFRESSFSHELAHAIQDCNPIHTKEYNDFADLEHENWNAVGIYKALNDIEEGNY